ncbi:MAG: hypothetical protein HLUCCA11_20500 [Phormidesmis priestleyi Ana]|uniref:Uncharacterized protein n=1 Tax=Phormidesmis priestleyi Ana TaxID=1666911 RepID=A0A0P7ZRY8_9CYAN|nr:MAG: hypothetical protein HLUCCA11_20500 [Phormidesmis priestleyi Ana]
MSRNALKDYFDAVEQQLSATPNAYVEQFSAVILTSERANLKLRVRFSGRYLLAISEALIVIDKRISQIDYRYHFQDEKNQLIFRYDSTPHFPDISTFPHHKHLSETVVATDKPDIFRVLEEAIALVEIEN